jgi:O-antigen/teichoic acid export membrane protein
MRLRDRLSSRALMALSLKVCGAASGLVATVIMARLMPVEDFGLVAFLTSLVSLAAIIALLGHEPLLIREISRRKEGEEGCAARGLLAHAGVVSLLLACLTGGAAVLLATSGLVPAGHAGAYVAAGLSLPLIVCCRIAGAALQGYGRVLLGDFGAQSLVQVGFLVAILPVAAVGLSMSADLAMAVRLGAAALAALVAGVILHAVLWRQPARPRVLQTRRWLAEAPPYCLLMLALFLISESDTLIVKLVAGDAAAGLYRPPQRIVWAISFGLMAVNTLMQPRISGLAASGRADAMQEVVSASVRMSLFLTVPAVLLVVGFAEPILALFGEAYRDGATALRILTLGQLVNTAMGPVAVLLNMTGHQRTTLRLTLLVVGLNAVLCIALTEALGIIGAASATAFSMAFWNVLLWRAVRQRLDVRPTALAAGVWHVRPLGATA